MGGSESKELPEPSPLTGPWRVIDWSKRDEMKECVRRFQISNPEIEYLRILIHGPVGAGKSSFINSIDTIFQERMACGAIAEAVTDHSCTKTYRAHKIKDGRYGSHLPFVMCDIMGLESGDSAGVHTDDLMKILEGHIKDGYVFNPTKACSEKDKGYKTDPDLKHKIHCVVNVIPADTLLCCADKGKVSDPAAPGIDEAFIQKFKVIRQHANFLGIPQVIILSKIDEACPKVKEDITKIYESTAIHKKINHCSVNVGVPLNCIFPVKNYHQEIHLNSDMDVLLLSALTNILNFANDYVEVMTDRKKKKFQALVDLPKKVLK